MTLKQLLKVCSRSKLFDIDLSSIFLRMSHWARAAIINKWDTRLKRFRTAKETSKTERRPTEWKKILANYISVRRSISKVFKEENNLTRKHKYLLMLAIPFLITN